MKGLGPISRRFLRVACGIVLLGIAVGGWQYSRVRQPRLPYHDQFANGKTEEWKAFGGTWEADQGAIRNNSDERGAKFITGSSEWTDYGIEADVMLLGQDGDAGLIVRSSEEEEGVDSYSGYYVGLRDSNNTVAIGRADHGWMEYQAVTIAGGIHPFRWYHLQVMAVGCEIVAVALDRGTSQSTLAAMHEPNCARTGRVGLRSYSSGGKWKDVRIFEAASRDLGLIRQTGPVADSPAFMQTEAGFNSLLPYATQKTSESSPAFSGTNVSTIHTPTLNSLRLASDTDPPTVTVRGSVILTSPALYLEDSTGGVAVEAADAPAIKIGDEVEATGTVKPRRFSAVLENATVRSLWARAPAPPLAITASQAATGSFDAMFVEVEGYLRSKARVPGQGLVLDLQSGHQTFRALTSGKRQDLFYDRLQLNSLLRLRGVSVVDPRYTENITSFALLLRSSDDVDVVSGPPWWDKRHIITMAFVLLIAGFVGFSLYSRAEHWRLRAVLEERSRMAREIHDTLAQGFAGIALQLESALREFQPHSDFARRSLQLALQMAQQSRREAHRSIAALRTLHTQEQLSDMLRKVLTQQVAGSCLQLRVSATGNERHLPEETEGQILRIAQEALANTMQHAHASCVEVRLDFGDEDLLAEIGDDGRGFVVTDAPTAENGHFGITGMRERAVRIGAELVLRSSPEGTQVILQLPLRGQRSAGWRGLRDRRSKAPSFETTGSRKLGRRQETI